MCHQLTPFEIYHRETHSQTVLSFAPRSPRQFSIPHSFLSEIAIVIEPKNHVSDPITKTSPEAEHLCSLSNLAGLPVIGHCESDTAEDLLL